MPRQIVYLELPFIGHATGRLRKELLLLVNRFYPQIDPKLYFKNNVLLTLTIDDAQFLINIIIFTVNNDSLISLITNDYTFQIVIS